MLVAGDASITDTSFLSNTATRIAGGAAISRVSSLSGNRFVNNTASDFGGAFAGGTSGIADSIFISNTADVGGGVFVNEAASITSTSFVSNTAREGGGISVGGGASINSTSFVGNRAIAGGGIDVKGIAHMTGTTFTHNFGGEGGGGALLRNTGYLTGTSFISNTAGAGGGLASLGTVTLTQTSFEENLGVQGGGAWIDQAANLEQSRFVNNSASQTGGALWFNGNSSVPTFIVNTLLADNRAARNRGHTLAWSGLMTGSQLTLIHNTLAQASAQDGSAIYVTGGALAITNTIIANQAIAIERAGGVVREDFNLFDNVTAPFSGTVTAGTHSITGTAAFADPFNGGYQLTALSDAIDVATNAGIAVDFFNLPRPYGNGFDMGYAEFSRREIYLPQIRSD
ncbi:hypothetical protein GC175_25970 [bacterium]|nr:hypothetical protein [bacterium]